MLSQSPFYNWTNYTILIVEDDVSSTFYIKEILKDTMASILHATDGQKAIELCISNPEIDIILMDIKMPIMDGYEATKAIKKILPDIPILAQTANAIYENRHLCLEAGCDDVILKPFDPVEMLERISTLLKYAP